MKKILKKLITFQSDKDHPQEIKKCFNFVVDYLKKSALKVKTYSSNKSLSLVAARKLKKNYHYILSGHLDVVPADYKNAFKPIIKGNRLYGRGASDMKGPDSAMIKLITDRDLKDVDCALMLTTDEEIGGFNGANYLLNKKNYSCQAAIIPDSGDNFQLTLAEKGLIHVKIKAQGKAVHGSQPWQGENAIEKLITVFQQIKKSLPQTTKKNRWLPTVNLGKIKGGDATNKVPSRAEMYLDFRYPQKKDQKKILNLLKKIKNKHKKIDYQILAKDSILINSPKNKQLQKTIKVAKKEGINLKFYKAHGASDGRFFSAKGIPTIMFKPQCSQAHVDNEWIDLKSLEKFYQILKKLLQQ